MSEGYTAFLARKSQLDGGSGFTPLWLPGFLFDFQAALVDWALCQGRAAIFADCGLGKTPMQLVWAQNVVRKTNRKVLVLTPLAVSSQTLEEAVKFSIEAARSLQGVCRAPITVTNYERLHHFMPGDFAGVVCDESSILKSFDGKRRAEITAFMRKVPYRLLCTATAAPNDYIELGTSSEALGYLGQVDMLSRFFKNDQGNAVRTNRNWEGSKWRFKGHAEEHFWRWVSSWARALRRPSDLGFSDTRFILPDLVEREHIIQARHLRDGMLFDLPAQGLWEEREESRRTITERCEAAASLVNGTAEPAVVWCHLNDESTLLARLIPDAIEVVGSDSPEVKEEAFLAFAHGTARVLVLKPKIGAFGLNWQHCAHMTVFPSHSYEQYYQAVRRCWRFGQDRSVRVDIIATEGGRGVQANLARKAAQADGMFTALVRHMNDALSLARQSTFTTEPEMPGWL
ncbi:MAG TPA: helicase [Candidatus Omnitrophica bacterium]|nr:helicase [Candidatus Omnitrophota bacterium]HBH96944.1 helicase [Candidatus Omnitrophota bacterium]